MPLFSREGRRFHVYAPPWASSRACHHLAEVQAPNHAGPHPSSPLLVQPAPGPTAPAAGLSVFGALTGDDYGSLAGLLAEKQVPGERAPGARSDGPESGRGGGNVSPQPGPSPPGLRARARGSRLRAGPGLQQSGGPLRSRLPLWPRPVVCLSRSSAPPSRARPLPETPSARLPAPYCAEP